MQNGNEEAHSPGPTTWTEENVYSNAGPHTHIVCASHYHVASREYFKNLSIQVIEQLFKAKGNILLVLTLMLQVATVCWLVCFCFCSWPPCLHFNTNYSNIAQTKKCCRTGGDESSESLQMAEEQHSRNSGCCAL